MLDSPVGDGSHGAKRKKGDLGFAIVRKILDEIQTGKFVRDWILECKSGQLNFKAEKRIQNQKQIEIVGEKLRKMMPWISSNKLVNKNKN